MKTRWMKEAPLLTKTDYDYKEFFFSKVKNKHNKSNSYFYKICKNYPNAMLDIFPYKLDDASQDLISDYIILSHEEKYLNFICDVFKENDEYCYLEYDFFNYGKQRLLDDINTLDLIDREILINHVMYFNKDKIVNSL